MRSVTIVHRHLRATSLSLSLCTLAAGLLLAGTPSIAGPGPGAAPAARAEAPELRIRTVVRGLEHPWDVQQASGGRIVVS